MAIPLLSVKGEKWPCAIKMKLEKVLALSLVFSFFPSRTLSLHHSFGSPPVHFLLGVSLKSAHTPSKIQRLTK